MSDKKKVHQMNLESQRWINQQANAIINRYENISSGMKNRIASLAGFAGVELAMVGTMMASWIKSDRERNMLMGAIYVELFLLLFCLITSIIFLLVALKPIPNRNEISFESLAKLHAYYKNRKTNLEEDSEVLQDELIEWIIEQNLQPVDQDISHVKGLADENDYRARKLQLASIPLALSQVLIGVLILTMYWS